ncbi:N-acetylglucosamine-6-sulfatase [Sesbania bispinosa]|nr:N-acetylglucosamine-6-sulfatase [Sesbania bispinosa]
MCVATAVSLEPVHAVAPRSRILASPQEACRRTFVFEQSRDYCFAGASFIAASAVSPEPALHRRTPVALLKKAQPSPPRSGNRVSLTTSLLYHS